MKTRTNTLLITLIVCLTLLPNLALGEVGVADKTVRIGMTNALEGPAKRLGIGVKTGAMVYIDKINKAGGVHGRKIEVVSYNDGYEPKKTVKATRTLINTDKVFLLFGYVGTPTSTAVVSIFSKAGVPYLFPFTGAEFLRHPINRHIFNVRASYFNETEGLVDHLIRDLGIKKIGVFIQDDAYGMAGKAGVERALRKRKLRLTGEGRYKRNTVNVDAGLAKLQQAGPEAIIMVGAYKPCAAFIKKAKKAKLNAKYLNVSFVGTQALKDELGDAGQGVIISQVMPMPTDSSRPVVKRYMKDMKAAGHNDFSFTTLEGYVDAVVLFIRCPHYPCTSSGK